MQLIAIHKKAAAITADRDPKLQELKRLIHDKIHRPLNDGNKKCWFFRLYAHRAYLYASLKSSVFRTGPTLRAPYRHGRKPHHLQKGRL